MAKTRTRTLLLEAATGVLLEHGADAATMEQVRLAAGVSNGSLYHHFPTKARLAAALYEQALRDFHSALRAPLDAAAGAEQGVRGMVLAALAWAEQQPAQARLLHMLRQTVQAAGLDAWSRSNDDTFGHLAAWAKQHIDAGHMRRLPWPVWQALVLAPVAAMTRQAAARGERRFTSEVRAALAEGAWRAVAPLPASSRRK